MCKSHYKMCLTEMNGTTKRSLVAVQLLPLCHCQLNVLQDAVKLEGVPYGKSIIRLVMSVTISSTLLLSQSRYHGTSSDLLSIGSDARMANYPV